MILKRRQAIVNTDPIVKSIPSMTSKGIGNSSVLVELLPLNGTPSVQVEMNEAII